MLLTIATATNAINNSNSNNAGIRFVVCGVNRNVNKNIVAVAVAVVNGHLTDGGCLDKTIIVVVVVVVVVDAHVFAER